MKNFISKRISEFKLAYHLKTRYVLLLGISIFLLAVFDSVMAYITPVIMLDSGLTEVQMGLLYSTSSVFGIVIDILLTSILKSTHYKRTLIYASLISITFPLLMFIQPSVIMFLIAMFVWALYFNLWSYATTDFTSRESKAAFHVYSVSFIMIFSDFGGLSGTLLAQPLIENFTYSSLVYILVPIILLSILFQLPGIFQKKLPNSSYVVEHTMVYRFQNLLKVGKKLFPLLILGTTITVIEAVTWTVTPVIERVAPELEGLGAIILAVNYLPTLLSFSISKYITDVFGKKRTGIISFMIGSLMLMSLGFNVTAYTYLIITFFSSLFITLSIVAITGAYADYLRESKSLDREILGVSDISMNIGFILGPFTGGLLLYLVNSTILFTYLGGFAFLVGFALIFQTPKKIPFHDKYLLNGD